MDRRAVHNERVVSYVTSVTSEEGNLTQRCEGTNMLLILILERSGVLLEYYDTCINTVVLVLTTCETQSVV